MYFGIAEIGRPRERSFKSLATPNLYKSARALAMRLKIKHSLEEYERLNRSNDMCEFMEGGVVNRQRAGICYTLEVTKKRKMHTRATWNSASGHDSKHIMVMNWNDGVLDLDRGAESFTRSTWFEASRLGKAARCTCMCFKLMARRR